MYYAHNICEILLNGAFYLEPALKNQKCAGSEKTPKKGGI